MHDAVARVAPSKSGRGSAAPAADPRPRGLSIGAPFAVFALLAILYAVTANRTVGPGDSGMLTVAMTGWGVTHAPGYPLLTLIGNLVTHLIRLGEPAFVLNLMNALFAAATCATLAAAVGIVTGSAGAGIVAGLALGVSRVFWLQALAIEVLSFNAWMASLLLYLLALALESREARAILAVLPWMALVATTAVTHHLTLVLIAAPVAAAYVIHAWRHAGSAEGRRSLPGAMIATAAAIVVGLLPLLYLPLAARLDPPLDWGNATDLHGVLRHLLRRDFGSGTLTSPGLAANLVLMNGESASPLGQRNLIAFWTDLPRSLGIGLLALAIAGVVRCFRRDRALLVMLVFFLAAMTLFFTRVNTPFLPFYQCVTERFYILPHVVFAFFAGLGAASWIAWAERRRWPQASTSAVAVLVSALPLVILHAPVANQRDNTFTRDLGSNLMAGMPAGAIFFSTGDMFRSSFLYQRECLGKRRDLSFVDEDLMVLPWYVDQLRRRGTLRLPEPMTGASSGSLAWLEANAGHEPARPAVAIKFPDDSYSERYRLEPRGIWSRVLARRTPVDLAQWERELSGIARKWELGSLRRPFPEASWEASDAVFYPFACGQLLGLRDLLAIVHPDGAPAAAVPALEEAARWRGKLGAELLAYRAEFLAQNLRDSLVSLPAGADTTIVARAMTHARAALALDATDAQALQTLAFLLARRGERAEELEVRRRLVELRPGDYQELVAYLRLAMRMTDGTPDGGAILPRAEEARSRFVRLLGIAGRLAPNPQIAAVRERWSRPLPEIDDLR